MKNERLEAALLDEQFTGINMSTEERDYCLTILRNCKDICDSENKVNGTSKCELLRLILNKENNIISADGYLCIGSENRYLNADIYFNRHNIIVDMKITRLGVECKNKIYTVLDEFILENDFLKRKSVYNYEKEFLYKNIENEEMKGKLK